MAKASFNKAKVAATKVDETKDVRIVVELKIPQLNNQELFPNSLKSGVSLFLESEHGGKAAKVSITPVNNIHVVEMEVNTQELVKDADVQANQSFIANGNVSSTRPISIFIHVTGVFNTMISFEVEIAGQSEFKGDLFIPISGRLVIQKIIP